MPSIEQLVNTNMFSTVYYDRFAARDLDMEGFCAAAGNSGLDGEELRGLEIGNNAYIFL